ncbi:hypothetical protein RHMOL_Rhmol10G0174800 [Rhododendron molle]|uniref:Uncharacterized protein n=1 Tax=Rhododendron molle TaxID=49168 RepID=A0ACC0M3D8_RHOML|nr:hypothetical protein RHMOL_Rhmol10G0174800 [Rhododendron molle]
MSWTVSVVDAQGNPAEIHLAPAKVEPPPVIVPVPNEWVNEAIRRMLALENVVRRAASGFPLELRYPAPSPPRGQRAAAKKPQVYNNTFLLSILKDALLLSKHMLWHRDGRLLEAKGHDCLHRRSWQPGLSYPWWHHETDQELAASCCKQRGRQTCRVRAEEQFRIAMRKRPASEEQRAQKKSKLVLLPTSEDEEEDDEEEEEDEEEGEEEEEHSSAHSDFDDSNDDPAYKDDPKGRADDDDDDGDDDGGLKDWFRSED